MVFSPELGHHVALPGGEVAQDAVEAELLGYDADGRQGEQHQRRPGLFHQLRQRLARQGYRRIGWWQQPDLYDHRHG